MKNKKLKTTSLVNLIVGYVLTIVFISMIAMNLKEPELITEEAVLVPKEVIIEHNNTIVQEKIIYEPRRDLPRVDYVDHLDGVIVNDHGEVITSVVRDDGIIGHDRINSISDIHNRVINHRGNNRGIVERDVRDGHAVGAGGNVDHRYRGGRMDVVDDATVTYDDAVRRDNIVDPGLLDRRLREIDDVDEIGLDTKDGIALDRLTPVTNSDDTELGAVDDFDKIDVSADGGYGVGKGGQLYAYNFPSRGVGAGVGNGSLGAGGGAGAGLGAGIGEGVLNGESVPTLGGIGTYTMPGAGAEAGPGEGGGVGGLIGGAGAGGAAGLYTGRVTDMLGVGGPGAGGPGGGG